jgi:hypothetical protein
MAKFVSIGSTHIITPNQFIDDLKTLDQPSTPVKSEVPAYAAAATTAATGKAATGKTLPPRTSSSQPASSKLNLKKW